MASLLQKPLVRELAWLLGSWAFSYAVVGAKFGSYRGSLDIQLHNTYFVVSVAGLATVFFLVLAPVVTGARVLASRPHHAAPSRTLAALSGSWLLIILAVCAVRLFY